MSSLETALKIAQNAHRGQTDRHGRPYILHPLRVMSRVTGEAAQITALLHDVVEKSDCTLDELRAQGFDEEVVAAVDALSRREGESYLDLVRRAKPVPLALEVKLSDLRDHLLPELVFFEDETSEKDTARMRRFVRAYQYLEGRMTEADYLNNASDDERAPK